MKKIAFVLAIITLMSCILTSCGANYKSYHIDENYQSIRENNPYTTVNGVDGIKVTVPKEISSAACFSPEAAIIMDKLGLSGKIIAVDASTSVVLKKTEATISNIASKKPDVIFVTDDYDTAVLDDSGIPFFTIPKELTLNDIKSLIKLIEKIFNITSDSLSLKIDASQNVAQQNTQSMINKYPTFVDMGVDRSKFKTSGKGTYINEIISMCGGENIFADEKGFIEVSKEDIIAANPAFIFTTSATTFTSDPAFAEVDAVKNKRVYRVQSSAEIDMSYGTHKIAGIIDYMHEKIMAAKDAKK